MLELDLFAIRLLSFAVGTLLWVFLLANLARKPRHGVEDWLLIGLAAAAGAWELSNALEHYLKVAAREPEPVSAIIGTARDGAAWLAAALSAAVLLCGWRKTGAPYRRFHACFALCLVGLAVSSLNPTLLAVVALAPPLCLLRFIYRFNVFDLVISRRVLFVFTLAGVSALYLVLVRMLAGWLETRLEVFGPLVEVTLVLGAAVTWVPMYEVITRFFSRQNRIYAEFSKRVIEEAARILEFQPRMQYLVEEVGRTFGLRRAVLVACSDAPQAAEFGPPSGEDWTRLTEWPGDEGRERLAAKGFRYLFPLRYEDRLTGMLLVDPAPRAFLDESEETLLGLSRQISLSLESCRLAEAKIALEKELLLQEHLATLGKVAATIAHEVKNPLSSIKTLAQLLREDPEVVARYDRDLDYMIAEVDRLNGCVQQLLTYARPVPELGGELELSELIESAAGFLARESARQGVRIQCVIAPELRLARADRQTVQQIVLNLLLNAVQASTPGSSVLLDAERQGDGRIRLRITDQGPGIPDEIRGRIFEPFFTTRQQGAGLGLAIVKKNVRQLGGELQLQTPVADGRGTSVAVTFPAAEGG